MYGHEAHVFAIIGLSFVRVRHESDFFHELDHGVVSWDAFVRGSHRKEFSNVPLLVFEFVAFVMLFEVFPVFRNGEKFVHEFPEFQFMRSFVQREHYFRKFRETDVRLLRQRLRQRHRHFHRFHEVAAEILLDQIDDFGDAFRAESPRRNVYHPLERIRILRVDEDVQVSHDVLDFHTFDERESSVNAVRYLVLYENVFYDSGNVVVPIQDSPFREILLLENLFRQRFGFGIPVVAVTHPYRFSFPVQGKRLLVHADFVLLDYGVGRFDDGGGRSVIAFEFDNFCIRVILRELEDVLHIGASERIDRLPIVSDYADVAVFRSEKLHNLVLHSVRVLVLVYEEMREFPL